MTTTAKTQQAPAPKSTSSGGIGLLYKFIAVLIWAGSTYATYLFLAQIGVEGRLAWLAVPLQLVFTYMESAIWRGRATWVNLGLLVVDIFTNIGGVFVYCMNLPNTDSYKAISTALESPNVMPPMVALVLSLIIGTFLAASPEAVWRQK